VSPPTTDSTGGNSCGKEKARSHYNLENIVCKGEHYDCKGELNNFNGEYIVLKPVFTDFNVEIVDFKDEFLDIEREVNAFGSSLTANGSYIKNTATAVRVLIVRYAFRAPFDYGCSALRLCEFLDPSLLRRAF
jgi:hypothetical protein